MAVKAITRSASAAGVEGSPPDRRTLQSLSYWWASFFEMHRPDSRPCQHCQKRLTREKYLGAAWGHVTEACSLCALLWCGMRYFRGHFSGLWFCAGPLRCTICQSHFQLKASNMSTAVTTQEIREENIRTMHAPYLFPFPMQLDGVSCGAAVPT